jgi:hypothetical protein
MPGVAEARIGYLVPPPTPVQERAPVPPDERVPVASTEEPAPAAGARFTRVFDLTSFRRGNLHTHTNKSDGDSTPSDVYAWYRTHGYDFVVITDHNMFTNPLEYVTEPHPEFLVIGGEEVTMRGAGREVHVNALCTKRVVPGGTFPSAREALAHGVLEIRSTGGIALINHPNFTWGIKSSDLAAAAGANLLEIYSGHPFVPSSGRPGSPSHEVMWDMTLTEGLDYIGVAVDDMHRLRSVRGSRPGRAWVEVFADRLDTATVCDALERGLLYSSSGPSLRRIRVTEDSYAIWPADRNVDVVFIGSGGRLLSTQKAGGGEAPVSYRIEGSEGYVRARVVRADGKVAWTPAVRDRAQRRAPSPTSPAGHATWIVEARCRRSQAPHLRQIPTRARHRPSVRSAPIDPGSHEQVFLSSSFSYRARRRRETMPTSD